MRSETPVTAFKSSQAQLFLTHWQLPLTYLFKTPQDSECALYLKGRSNSISGVSTASRSADTYLEPALCDIVVGNTVAIFKKKLQEAGPIYYSQIPEVSKLVSRTLK